MRSLILLLILLLSPLPSFAQTPPQRPTLRMGSEGDTVRELQAALQLLGYYRGEVTGLYNEQTIIAVSLFQRASNLPVDGIVNESTWQRLFPTHPPTETRPPTASEFPPAMPSTSPRGFPAVTTPALPSFSPTVPTTQTVSLPPMVRFGSRGDTVRQLQLRLQTLGFFNGRIDGVFGSRTLAAVKAAQQQFNLRVDGIVGAETWQVLFR